MMLCGTLEKPPIQAKRGDKMDASMKEIMNDLLQRFASSIEKLGLEISAVAAAETLKEVASEETLTYDQLEQRIGVLDITARRELGLVKLYAINNDVAKYMGGGQPCFGPDVDLRFPAAAADIAEAGSCLAFGRGTACVFHLMRVMEHGLRAVNACLGLPDPTGGARNWGILLEDIQKDMTKRAQNSNAGWNQKGDKSLFHELHGSLDAVRSAWRNATMHIERAYSEEEAEHAYLMVRAFMKKIAARMDENGDSKA
jgi:hypothetical protein